MELPTVNITSMSSHVKARYNTITTVVIITIVWVEEVGRGSGWRKWVEEVVNVYTEEDCHGSISITVCYIRTTA